MGHPVSFYNEVASEVVGHIKQGQREDGTLYYFLDDGTDSWHQQLLLAAIEYTDDVSWDMVYRVLNNIAEYRGEYIGDADAFEPDVYSKNLHNWLSSNLDRAAYVNEAIENLAARIYHYAQDDYMRKGLGKFGKGEDMNPLTIDALLMQAQCSEASEMFGKIIAYIDDNLEPDAEEEEEEE